MRARARGQGEGHFLSGQSHFVERVGVSLADAPNPSPLSSETSRLSSSSAPNGLRLFHAAFPVAGFAAILAHVAHLIYMRLPCLRFGAALLIWLVQWYNAFSWIMGARSSSRLCFAVDVERFRPLKSAVAAYAKFWERTCPRKFPNPSASRRRSQTPSRRRRARR